MGREKRDARQAVQRAKPNQPCNKPTANNSQGFILSDFILSVSFLYPFMKMSRYIVSKCLKFFFDKKVTCKLKLFLCKLFCSKRKKQHQRHF